VVDGGKRDDELVWVVRMQREKSMGCAPWWVALKDNIEKMGIKIDRNAEI